MCGWESKDSVFFNLCPMGTTITADIYCQQVDKVQTVLIEKILKMSFVFLIFLIIKKMFKKKL